MTNSVLLPVFYAPPISWFSEYLKSGRGVLLEVNDHFQKQTYRNRMEILAANGPQKLSIPIRHDGARLYKEIRISYREDWKQQHLRSLISAYGKAAFFEFFEGELQRIYEFKTDFLLEFNFNTLHIIEGMLGTEVKAEQTKNFQPLIEGLDLRADFSPKNKKFYHEESYFQVFSDRWAFQKDLSILDLVFNLGPESVSYLRRMKRGTPGGTVF